MIISQLSLSHFRNHSNKSYSFSPQTTVIIGPNASGKTNILEAIFLLATGKSFRADSDRDMIGFGKELARISSLVKKAGDEVVKLEMVLTTGTVHTIKTPYKSFSAGGVGKRMIDFVGQMKVVLFWPEDLELVTDSPSIRRRYLDFVLTQLDREYRRCLISYEKGLRQRNHLLESIREKGMSRNQLLFWDQLLIKNGNYLTKKRAEYIEYLNTYHSTVTSNQFSRYQLFYDSSVISPLRFEQYKEQEIASATTLVGPHRDDFQFSMMNAQTKEQRDLSQYGSRGEQRLAVLWLKLGELSYIESCYEEHPVLLLDDIFSELDHEHRKIVFELLGKQQTIMTTSDPHYIDKEKLQGVEIIEF